MNRHPVKRHCWLLFVCLTVGTGCSDDPSSPGVKDPAAVVVELPAASTAFLGLFDQANHPREMVAGPFELQVFNKRYSFEQSALQVTLQVTNRGDSRPGGPVGLTVRPILPRGVIVVNPPQAQPLVTFEFADGDGVWSSQESSLPVTVSFGTTPDQDLTFVAELATSFGSQSGLISGTVWRDDNSDGVRDAGEPGAGGLAVDLYEGLIEVAVPAPRLQRVLTGADGGFAFGELAAGAYHLRVESRPYLLSTTAAVRDTTLEADNLGVLPVAHLDFGLATLDVDDLTLIASADATIRADVSSRENDNHGADPYLAVGTTRSDAEPNDAIRGLVRFDLGLLERPVLAAYLELTIARFRDGSFQTYELAAHPIIPSGNRTPWVEGNGTEVGPAPVGAVWVDQAYGVAWRGVGDGGDANNQTQPDFHATAAATATVVQTDHQPGAVITWDVTQLVNDWLDGTRPNHGLVLRDTNPAGSFRQLWFWSRDALEREYDIFGAQEGPRLVLIYD